MTVPVDRGPELVDRNTPWEVLAREHASRIYPLAYGLTRSPHDAEDLTQDVFDRVFRSLRSYTRGNFDGWLYRITVNMFRDQVRQQGRLRLEPLREDTVDRYRTRRPDPDPAGGPVFDDGSRIHRARAQLRTALAHRAPRTPRR